jgi:uncharacterized protein (TIGR02453 family)
MLQSSTLKFLNDLQKNNNKPWFDEHRKVYETAKQNFLEFTEELIKGVSSFDKTIEHLTAKECTYRINRDVRFSKNKSPYKNNMAAYFNLKGKKGNGAGYYFHCQPGESFAAGGVFMPMPPELAKIRQEIDYSFEDFKKIINNKTFKKYFPNGISGTESLSRPPKGYDENNPAIDFLKMKGFIVSRKFTDTELLQKNTIKEISKTFEAIKPLVGFINYAIE